MLIFSAFEESKQILFACILLNKIDMIFVLENSIQSSYIGMLTKHLNFKLRSESAAKIFLYDFTFFHYFESIETASILLRYKIDLTEGSCS